MKISEQFHSYCKYMKIDYDNLPPPIQVALKRAYFAGFTDCIHTFNHVDSEEEAEALVNDYVEESVKFWNGLLNSEN